MDNTKTHNADSPKPSTIAASFTTLAVLVALFAGTFFAYNAGFLDPIIEKIGAYMFKAKMKAAASKENIKEQGLAAGQGLVNSGNNLAEGVGSNVVGSVGDKADGLNLVGDGGFGGDGGLVGGQGGGNAGFGSKLPLHYFPSSTAIILDEAASGFPPSAVISSPTLHDNGENNKDTPSISAVPAEASLRLCIPRRPPQWSPRFGRFKMGTALSTFANAAFFDAADVHGGRVLFRKHSTATAPGGGQDGWYGSYNAAGKKEVFALFASSILMNYP
ncbi:hypothetical protein G7046_g4500 [Stylonectria norvegica]|nr:hypothetical protein G7046_g4500 [Stylonectria norvegica]